MMFGRGFDSLHLHFHLARQKPGSETGPKVISGSVSWRFFSIFTVIIRSRNRLQVNEGETRRTRRDVETYAGSFDERPVAPGMSGRETAGHGDVES